ncbi:MAG TPA: 1-acyl-sn-glycerol-3-phosphate acyltransferase [Myxococcota bacterium]|nr:1-acyl-sn-glycerol-3-phosphate acyltransferase [Myxococcota bacterium]
MRRAWTIPGYVAAWLVSLALAPFAALGVWLGAGVAARLLLFAAVYLSYEMIGLAAAGLLFVAGRARDRQAHAALQRWWACSLFRAAARIFRLELEVAGDEAAEPGPVVVLIRHASLLDTLLPEVVLADRHRLQLRYVLKRELLADPCLDVVGQRIQCAFVRRGSGETERELAAIESLARGLGPREGALIYPEGTRFTPDKLARALERVQALAPERSARVSRLRHVLPVRSAGPLALLAAAAPADALWFAHTGLEGLATLRDVLRGGIVGRRIRVALWRTPRSVIPAADALRWLDEQWARVDDWVDAARAEAG